VKYALLVAAVFLVACEDSARFTSGLGEPMRVTNAQFIAGELPSGTSGPKVVLINSPNNSVVQGEVGKSVSGDVDANAAAIALKLDKLGSGFWVLPVGSADLQMPGASLWDASIDFARNIAPGKATLDFVANDASGNYGPIKSLPLTIQSLTPTGAAVFTLAWDDNADLDLHVVTPSGKEVDPKHMTTSPDGGTPDTDPTVGALDRDSNAACVIDGYRQEDLVFQKTPPPGIYQIRVDMFSACGLPAANFTVDVTVNGASRFHVAGRLIDIDADGGGDGSGLFVGQVTL